MQHHRSGVYASRQRRRRQRTRTGMESISYRSSEPRLACVSDSLVSLPFCRLAPLPEHSHRAHLYPPTCRDTVVDVGALGTEVWTKVHERRIANSSFSVLPTLTSLSPKSLDVENWSGFLTAGQILVRIGSVAQGVGDDPLEFRH